MTRAILLSAGHGTRLGTLSDIRPKPLLPVCDIPILQYNIALLVGHGIRNIVVNLHHHADQIVQCLGTGEQFGARIQYSREESLLGTGGALKKALPLLDPKNQDVPILVMNGKLIFDLDIHALLTTHKTAPQALATMVVQRLQEGNQFSAVDVQESPTGARVRNIFSHGTYMFCGVHITRASVIRRLPDGVSCSIRQGYLPWILQGQQVAAHIVSGRYFAEHSTVERYLESNFALLDGAPLQYPPGQLVGVDSSAKIAPSATVRPPIRIGPGALIGTNTIIGPHAVIGRYARIANDSNVERSVVWPKVSFQGTAFEQAIIASTGVGSA